MAFTDKELLDFDTSSLAGYQSERLEDALKTQGDVFRAQLGAAVWIDGWRRRFSDRSLTERTFEEGVDFALREVVAHLRMGDLLPDGVLIREECGDLK